MRTEGNPLKINPELNGYKKHRIIMPVYIPNEEGYYKDAFEIFKMSIHSLIATIDTNQVNITVINNSCMPEVDEYIRKIQEKGSIDQYIVNEVNRGKYDSILAASKATYEPFITICDADALFIQGWLNEIDAVYDAFPQAGVVCPFPAPNLRYLYTFYTWLKGCFYIRWNKIVSDEDLTVFANNVGIPQFFSKEEYRRQFYLQKGKSRALIGSGHFVATYRNVVFQKMPFTPTCKGLKGGLINIEKKIDSMGLMRLSLPQSKVLHMGNLLEEWMHKRYESILSYKPIALEKENVSSPSFIFRFPEWLRRILMKGIFIVARSLEKIT